MEEDIEKELILSKIDYVISLVRDNEEVVKILNEIEKDVKEY